MRFHFFSGLSCAGPSVHLLRRGRSSRIHLLVLPWVRFCHPAQTVVAFLVLASLTVPSERVVTSPGGMVLRWYWCFGIRCVFGNINSSKENPRASPVPSGLCHRAGLAHLHPIAAGIA